MFFLSQHQVCKTHLCGSMQYMQCSLFVLFVIDHCMNIVQVLIHFIVCGHLGFTQFFTTAYYAALDFIVYKI